MTVRPVKTQISLGIRPVWSETSPCAQWVAKDPSFLHADSKDWSQMPRLIWVFAGRACHFVGFVMRWLIWLPQTYLYLHFRYELRVRYLPKSFHELYSKDKVTFYYLYDQVCAFWIFSIVYIWAAAWQNQQNDLCAQWRLRSAWATAQSDQSLRCPHEETLDP